MVARSPRGRGSTRAERAAGGARRPATPIRAAQPSLWSRARNRTDTFPSVVAVIELLLVENAVIGGETVLLLADGPPDFGALCSKPACRDARLIAFDLRGVNGEDLRRMPLDERRSRPASLSAGPEDAPRSPAMSRARKMALFRHACAMNLEGIVCRNGSTLRPTLGRSII